MRYSKTLINTINTEPKRDAGESIKTSPGQTRTRPKAAIPAKQERKTSKEIQLAGEADIMTLLENCKRLGLEIHLHIDRSVFLNIEGNQNAVSIDSDGSYANTGTMKCE